MNLNELNKIEEAMFAGIRGMLSGQGKQQTKVQDIFIKDFMQDAIASINNGLAGGLIANPKDAAPGASAGNTQNLPPNSASASGATQDDSTVPGQEEKPQTQYMGKVAPNAGPATKPQAAPNPLATPTLNQPKTTVNTTLGTASKPGSITSGGPGAMPSPKATAKPGAQPYKWAPKGMKVDPNTKLSSVGAVGNLAEAEYIKLNRLFENIVNIDEQTDLMPMSEYMMNWFSQYMQNVAWEGSKPAIQTQVDKLAAEYPNNLKSNLQKLAQTALALSKAASKPPAGAPQEFTQMRNANIQNVQQGYEEIKAALDELSKINPDLYNKFIKTLRPVGLAEQKKRK
jgi:hypothetical protein